MPTPFSVLLLASLSFPALSTAAQDLVAIAPQLAKVEYEDARIRVVRLHIPAKGSIPMHDRPARVVIPLTENDVTTTAPDGASRAVRAAAGKPAWSGPARRSVQNLGGPLENIIVEVKNAGEAARPLEHPPSPPPAGYLEDKFHRWLFENQYVRVYEGRIPPGGTTEFHRHAFDTVEVFISGGTVATQIQGGSWRKPETTKAGTVDFDADSKKPFTHRVRNEGAAEFHVILVQVLQ